MSKADSNSITPPSMDSGGRAPILASGPHILVLQQGDRTRCFGPFDSPNQAERWMDSSDLQGNWWLEPLELIVDAAGIAAGRALAQVIPFHPAIYLAWCARLAIHVGLNERGLWYSWDDDHCTATPDQVDMLQVWLAHSTDGKRALRKVLQRREAA